MRKQILILAGGPKAPLRAMAPICGQPALYWQLLALKEQDYTDIFLLVGALLEDQVREYFGSGERLGLHLQYVVDSVPLRTGGAVRRAISVLKEDLEDEFIVLNGEQFVLMSFDDVAGFFDEGRFAAVAPTYEGKELAYVVNKSVFDSPAIKELIGPFSIKEVLSPLRDLGYFGTLDVQCVFYDIRNPERMTTFEKYVAKEISAGRLHGREPEGVL